MASTSGCLNGLPQRAIRGSALPWPLLICLCDSSWPILMPLGWPSLHHVLCLPYPCPLWLSSLLVAHLKDRRLSGGAGSPWPLSCCMDTLPSPPTPPLLYCNAAATLCLAVVLESSVSCSVQSPSGSIPCSSADPGLQRAPSRMGA